MPHSPPCRSAYSQCSCIHGYYDCASLWPLRDVPLRVDAGEAWGSERCGGPMPSSASFSGLSLGLGAESAASSGAGRALGRGRRRPHRRLLVRRPRGQAGQQRAGAPRVCARARSSAADLQRLVHNDVVSWQTGCTA